MNVLEAIDTRRSIRAYEPRPVEDANLKMLLREAVKAPSAMNAQPWLFAVVEDRAQLKRLSGRGKALILEDADRDAKRRHHRTHLADPQFDIFYGAPALVVIGAAERGPYVDADAWLAAGTLMIAARERGLGSCCIGFAIPVLNEPDVLLELGFAVGGVAIAAIVLGYPAESPHPVLRHEPKIVSWSRAADAR